MRRLLGWMVVVLIGAGVVLAQQASGKPDGEKQPDTSAFSDRVASSVLDDLRDGLEGHSQRLMLSAFDRDKMEGYLTFADQIQAFFQRYETFRVHYGIAQSM